MTPEGRVKSAVDKALITANAYKHKPVMNGMGEPALDYHVCHRGIYCAIETKAKGEHPTVRQTRTMRKVLAGGGALFLINSAESNDMAQLNGWLLHPTPGFVSKSAAAWLASKEANDKRDD